MNKIKFWKPKPGEQAAITILPLEGNQWCLPFLDMFDRIPIILKRARHYDHKCPICEMLKRHDAILSRKEKHGRS